MAYFQGFFYYLVDAYLVFQSMWQFFWVPV